MIPHRGSSKLWITFLQRTEYREVFVGGGFVDAVVPIAHDIADGLDNFSVAIDLRKKASIPRTFGNDAMQTAVMLPIWIDPAGFPDGGKGLHEGFENGGGDTASGKTSRLYFEEGTNFVNFANLIRAEGKKNGSAVATKFDEAKSLHFKECLSHRSPAHSEFFRGLDLSQSHSAGPIPTEKPGDESTHDHELSGGSWGS